MFEKQHRRTTRNARDSLLAMPPIRKQHRRTTSGPDYTPCKMSKTRFYAWKQYGRTIRLQYFCTDSLLLSFHFDTLNINIPRCVHADKLDNCDFDGYAAALVHGDHPLQRKLRPLVHRPVDVAAVPASLPTQHLEERLAHPRILKPLEDLRNLLWRVCRGRVGRLKPGSVNPHTTTRQQQSANRTYALFSRKTRVPIRV